MNLRSLLPSFYTLGLGLGGIGALIALTDVRVLFASFGPLAFFAALSMFVKRAGFHVAPQVTHSLVGIVDLAAVLIFRPLPGAWVGAVSGFLYLFLNSLRREKHTAFNLIEIPIFNAGLKIGMAYASAHLYTLLGGEFFPREFSMNDVPALAAAVAAWFVVDHLGWAVLEWTRGGWAAFTNFLRRILPYSLATELLPLPFAIVIAVVYDPTRIEMFLMLAAGLIGTAVIVQMFADTSARLERRRNELSVLNEFGEALARAGFESEKIVDLLYAHTRRIVAADHYRVEFFDSARAGHWHSLRVLDATESEPRHPYERAHDARAAEYFAARRAPIVWSASARADAPVESRAWIESLRAEFPALENGMGVPLYSGDQLIGALTLLSTRARPFFPAQARALESICSQAAVTIQNARLYAAERTRAAQLATISEVSRKVAALLDLDELLQSIVSEVRERFGYGHVHIFTVDKETGYANFRASTHPRGGEWRTRGIGYRIGLEGLVGWVAAMGEPLVVNDVRGDARFLPYPDHAVDETRAEIVVPLVIGDRVVGVLDVESGAVDAFGDQDLFILTTLAAQVAIALEDARLFNAQKEEAYYLNVLLQVAQNLSATTDLADALETVVRITPLLVGVERCAIFLFDPAAKIFAAAKAYGLTPAMQTAFDRLRFRTDDAFAFAQLYQDQKPVFIEDAATSDLLRADVSAMFSLRSLLLVPLVSRGEMVGGMVVDQGAREKKFNAHEIEVLMGIATQAAVAIESARLGAAAESQKQFEYELRFAQQIQTSFLPEACPEVAGYDIRAHWQTAREVSGDFYDFVPLSGGRLGITIADVSDKGMAAALFMALSRTILRTMAIGKPTAREAMERANDVILADARSEMFVTVFYAVLDPHKHKLTYVNAGHNPPLLYRAAKKDLRTLKGHSIALGVKPNATMEEKTIALELGDVVLMYTDGVTDAINAAEEEFGMERLAELVLAGAERGAEELALTISRAVADFAGDRAQFDDVTMVAVKRK